MHTRLIGLLLLILLLLLSGLPLAAQEVALLQKAEVMVVRPGEAAPAFACAEEDCERLAWLPAGANVALIAEMEGRTLEDNGLWYEVLLDCPCFDYERSDLTDLPNTKDLELHRWYSWHPYWSPDGTRIATVAGSVLYVWDATSGERRVKESLDIFHSYHMAWSPDGTRIVAGGGVRFGEGNEPRYEPERNLLIVGADGHFPAPLTGQDKGVSHVAWSHDGTRIAAAGDELRIWDVQQGTSLVTVESSASIVDWSPDDTRIVTNSHEGVLRVRDADSGEVLNSLGGDFDDIYLGGVQFSPHGSRIAYTFNLAHTINDVRTDNNPPYGSLRIWDGVGQDHPSPLIVAEDWVLGISWSPDGRFLVYSADGAISIVDTDDGRTLARLFTKPDLYTGGFLGDSLAWSPDGNRIVASGIEFSSMTPEGAALVWDLTLIPEGRALAFIHSSQLTTATPLNG